MKAMRGFTLVELAIVMTIIGLLIGGVLKGQELLENSRMTSAAAQIKSIAAAALTFRDVYKALPGDIITPANFIQNCTAAPCNVSGDGNGLIGPTNTNWGDENNAFYLHLAKAGLLSGIDPNSNWAAGTRFAASYPAFPIGGQLTIFYSSVAANATYPDGVNGHYYYPQMATGGGTSAAAILAHNKIAKLDLKIDDARPYQGDVLAISNCGLANGATAYDPNNVTLCNLYIRTGL